MGWNDIIGGQLGSYTIIAEIARGGMSRVYRAHAIEGDGEAAVKVMTLGGENPEVTNTFVQRFEHEARAIKRLDHPNIVRVFETGETDEFVFIAMQLVLGGTFRQRLGQPLSVSEACTLMIQMARALHHAHLNHIIHRDVKPANMLIDKDNPNHLLLADFGIAKIMGQKGVTKTGTAVGTPEYMAPEQAKGEDIDPRADIYGLACVLYEALAGRPPFVGPTALSICYQHVHTRPAYIRGFNPEVPRSLALVIEQALAKNPRERFPTAEAFAAALYPFTEPTSMPIHRVTGALPPMPAEYDLRGTPDEIEAGSAVPNGSPPAPHLMPPEDSLSSFRPDGGAVHMLDLSTVSQRPPTHPLAPPDDDTMRTTQEMVPVAAPARPRHVRSTNPSTPLRNRSITSAPASLAAHANGYDVTKLSTVQQPATSMPPGAIATRSLARRLPILLAVALVLLGAIAVLAYFHAGSPSKSHPLVVTTQTATSIPPTATSSPTTTPRTTPSPQATSSVNNARFAVPLATVSLSLDRTCSNNQTSFPAGSVVYYNACVAPSYPPGTLSFVVKFGGTPLTPPITPIFVSQPGWVYYSYSYELPAGSYTLIVYWNNHVAHTIDFTVG